MYDGIERFNTIDEIKARAAHAGSHFFDKGTIEFFDSRIGRSVFGGRYFITSEQFHGPDESLPRKWTIRECTPQGDINTVGEFQQYATPNDAVQAARSLAEEDADANV